MTAKQKGRRPAAFEAMAKAIAKARQEARRQPKSARRKATPCPYPLAKAPTSTAPTRTDYDADFIPILGPIRRARRDMLSVLFRRIEGKTYQLTADPFVAAELRRQEQSDEAALSALRAAFGRKANWRDALVFDAERRKDDLAELKWLLAHAVITGDKNEIKAFAAASCRVAKLKNGAEINMPRMFATLYGMHYERKHDKLPTRAKTNREMEAAGIKLPAGGDYDKNANRIYSGPYLSRFPKEKPWGTS
jgi:hypothetical protein